MKPSMPAGFAHSAVAGRPRSPVAMSLIVGAVLLSGCAYKYAGREGRVYTDERTAPPPPTQVITVQVPEEERERLAPQPQPEPACAVRTFDVHFYDASTRITKTIDCEHRRVVNVHRTPMGRTFYREAREANLPEQTWYLLVDPIGNRDDVLSNQDLMHLAQHFSVKLLGRDRSSDLLVYEYLDEI
jgi:hypothetical protein